MIGGGFRNYTFNWKITGNYTKLRILKTSVISVIPTVSSFILYKLLNYSFLRKNKKYIIYIIYIKIGAKKRNCVILLINPTVEGILKLQYIFIRNFV